MLPNRERCVRFGLMLVLPVVRQGLETTPRAFTVRNLLARGGAA